MRKIPTRKIIVSSLALFTLPALPTLTVRADEPRTRLTPAPSGGNDRLLLAPPSPFEPPRSLFEFDPRPSRRPIMPLYPTIERELLRGTDRIESDLEFDLRRRQRQRDERRGLLPKRREFERFDEGFGRTLRIEQQERRAERLRRTKQLIERESDRLAEERERFYKSAGIDVSGAVHDARMLKNLERAYQRDVKQLALERRAALKRLSERQLAGDELSAARTALDARHRAAQTARREHYAADRDRILGHDESPSARD